MDRKRFERLRADDRDERLDGHGLLRRRRGHRVKKLLSGGTDQGEGGADGGELSLLCEDAQNDAVDRRADFDGRLVGLDLDDRLVLDNRVALADEPPGDLTLGQAFTKIRKRERVRHGGQSSRGPHA